MLERRVKIIFDEKKFFETIEAVDTSDYKMRTCELRAIFKKNNMDIGRCAYDAFCYGFLKGQHNNDFEPDEYNGVIGYPADELTEQFIGELIEHNQESNIEITTQIENKVNATRKYLEIEVL